MWVLDIKDICRMYSNPTTKKITAEDYGWHGKQSGHSGKHEINGLVDGTSHCRKCTPWNEAGNITVVNI
jgi:hypothetical protein